MKQYLIKYGALVLLLLSMQQSKAQSAGSATTYQGLGVTSGDIQSDAAESLYIGPGTYQIDGTWNIYSKNVAIDPQAVITGAGTINFYNPSDAGGAASATMIDGNNSSNAIGVNIALQNASGAKLANIDFPSDLTASGFTNSVSNNVLTGAGLSLAINGANVDLNGNDLILNSAATISNYSANRLVITDNSITGHLVKQGLSSQFTFPVGIAANDYTPSTITPAASATVHVSVQDYSSPVPPVTNPATGIYRDWHIYADADGTIQALSLAHNAATDGTDFNWQQSYITDYTAGSWSTHGAYDASSDGQNSKNSVTLLGSSANAWYSATSDANNSLPVTLAEPFRATLQNCVVTLTWATGVEDNLDHFTLYASTDGKDFSKVIDKEAAKGNGSSYSFMQSNPASGMNYYELIGTDKDGSIINCGIESVNVGCATADLKVYPNPASGQATVSGLQPGDVLKIYNSIGQTVAVQTAKSGTAPVDLSRDASGVYFVMVIRDNAIIQKIKLIRK